MKRIVVLFVMLFSATAIVLAQDEPRKYGIKSGEVKSKTEMMGQIINATSWFDDYGFKEFSKTITNGVEVYSYSLKGKSYTVIPSMKQLQEMPAQEAINYMNLTDEVVKKYKIQEIGKETILGRECSKYSLELSRMGQTAKMTVSVWEGYVLKAVTEAAGISITITVTDFIEGSVDPSLFNLPSFD